MKKINNIKELEDYLGITDNTNKEYKAERNLKNKVLEIEDINGNTLFAINIDNKGRITDYKNCEIADYEKDRIFNTDKILIRLQQLNESGEF